MSSLAARVFPMRFSADPAAMIGFCEVLGLQKVLVSDNGGYAAFEGGAGSLAVHASGGSPAGARPAITSLNVLVADVDRAAAALRAAGCPATTWDEAYGRQGAVTTPDGTVLGLNEAEQADLHGYHAAAAPPAGSGAVDVVAVRYSHDFGAEASFFAHFGLAPEGPLDDPWWCALRGSGAAGTIGLHTPSGVVPVAADSADCPGPPALVRLGFETSEPLDVLAARLRDAGYEAALAGDEAGPKVVVTDPDGESVEIHPRG